MMEENKMPLHREEGIRSPNAGFFEWTETIALSLVVILLLFVFVLHTNTVVGSSMYPTLAEGDRLLVSNIAYDPCPGDIVIIAKKTFRASPVVKRVIAVEGQTVDIDFQTHEVFVDGQKLEEPYINEPTARSYDVEFPITVPEGCVFVMGDNRNASDDSRDSALGCVDRRFIQGKVILRYWPFTSFGVIHSGGKGD